MKKTTVTHARANLGQLWDKIERTKEPITLTRRGHEDMALLPTAELERLQDAAIAPFLALIGTDIAEHPERLRGFPPDLVARIRQLTAGIPIDHTAPVEGAVAVEALFRAPRKRLRKRGA